VLSAGRVVMVGEINVGRITASPPAVALAAST
jgi:hypothetical protein